MTKSSLPTLRQVMPSPLVDVMVSVAAASIPVEVRRRAAHNVGPTWGEVYMPTGRDGECQYGCKVYARRQGAVTRYAVLHSSTYGHPKPALRAA